jgi:hypothetical protein
MMNFIMQLDDTTQAVIVYVVLALAVVAIVGLVFRLARHGFRIKAGPVEIDCEDAPAQAQGVQPDPGPWPRPEAKK